MTEYVNSELYFNDSIDKQTKIIFGEGTIQNDDILEENFELSETLCSEEELRFGSCEASVLKFRADNLLTPLAGKWLTVMQVLNHDEENPLMLGKYKVVSDVPTADRRYRDVTAYDAMYDILNTDVTDWYNTILPNEDSTVTLKQFRDSFIAYFGLEQDELEEGLINDAMIVEKTIEPSELSGRDVITAICEINCCFGHIGRNGKFQYIYLEQAIQGLWPRNDLYPADDLYPRDPKSTRIRKSTYISCQYEDYLVRSISKLQIRQEENDVGAIVGDGDNCYTIEGNFLVYGKSAAELEEIGERLLGKIRGIVYRPFEADCKGNPCFEVGDAVRLVTRYEIVESYILQRVLKGIQALRDDYSAEGVEQYSGNINTVKSSILQLKGKTNELTRTVEETRLEMKDMEAGLYSTISITAAELRTDFKNTELGLSSRIAQNAEGISMEASRAAAAEGSLSAQIALNAQQIALKVDTNGIIQAINMSPEGIAITGSKLALEGYTTINGGFQVDTSGNVQLGDGESWVRLTNGGLTIRGVKDEAHRSVFYPSTWWVANTSVGRTVLSWEGNDVILAAERMVATSITVGLINGSLPVTAGNISNYLTSDYLPASYSSLTVTDLYTSGSSDTVGNRIAFLKDQVNSIWSDTKNIWSQITSLQSRVSALESAG